MWLVTGLFCTVGIDGFIREERRQTLTWLSGLACTESTLDGLGDCHPGVRTLNNERRGGGISAAPRPELECSAGFKSVAIAPKTPSHLDEASEHSTRAWVKRAASLRHIPDSPTEPLLFDVVLPASSRQSFMKHLYQTSLSK